MPALANSQAKKRRAWYQSTWLRPFNDLAALDGLLQRVQPRASLQEIRARVERVIDETADTRTFVLRANRHWPGHRAGQHVLVDVDVDGRRLQRCFSLSAAPGRRGKLQITVKRQRADGVSAWMNSRLQVGDVLRLSAPFGDFGCDIAESAPLLMISAGSGITPMIALLEALTAGTTGRDIVFVHSCRNHDQLILANQLQSAASKLPGLRLHLHFSNTQGRLDANGLRTLVPDFAARHTLACGPGGFNQWIAELYRAHGIPHQLELEKFGVPSRDLDHNDSVAQTVTCNLTEQSFTTQPGQSLLAAAESAGLSPRHGCRVGICRSCQCRRISGCSENLLTGEICDEPGQLIQLCISSARSALTLEIRQI